MEKLILKFATFILFVSHLSAAEVPISDRLRISVNTEEVSRLSRYEVDYIRKSAFEAIISSKIFEVTLTQGNTNSKSSLSYYVMGLKAKEVAGKKFDLEFVIKEEPSGLVINTASKRKVSRERVQIEARRLVYKVIYEENFNEEEEVILKPVPIRPLMERTKNKRKKNQKRKKAHTAPMLSNEEDPIEESGVEQGKLKKKEKDKKEEEQKQTEVKKRKIKKNTAQIAKFESPQIDLRKNVKKKEVVSKNLTLINKYNLSAGYETEEASSNSAVVDDISIQTGTSIQRMVVNGAVNIKVEEWQQYFQVGGSFTKIVSENAYSVTPRISMYGNYNLDVYRERLFGKFGFEYEKFSYVSLSQFGGGLEAFTNSVLWVGAGFQFYQELFGRTFFFEGNMKKAFIGTSDQTIESQDVVIDGNKIEFQFSSSVYKKIGIGIKYEASAFTAISDSDFDTEHSIVSLLMTYR